MIDSREPRLTTIADYLINAGGKRVRPAVALLVFRACGGHDVTDMVDLSVSLELIHTATLLHDDIIDSNDVRRGQAAAPVRFGIADTLVAGDFLFSRAFEVCGRFEAKVVAWAADACIQLTEGEIMQGRLRRNLAVTDVDYYGDRQAQDRVAVRRRKPYRRVSCGFARRATSRASMPAGARSASRFR